MIEQEKYINLSDNVTLLESLEKRGSDVDTVKVAAIITQLERIADSLEGIANCVEYVMPTEHARLSRPDVKGYYRIRIGGEVYGND